MTTPPRPIKRAPTAPATPAPKPRPTVQASADPFADLQSGSPTHGRFLMLYSEAGEGKTTLAAQFPKPMFITTSGEQGAWLYKQSGKLPADVPVIGLEALLPHDEIPKEGGHPGWNKCITTMTRFRDANHGRETLIIDSVSGLQDLCFQHCASVLYKGDMDSDEFTGFFKGYSKAAEAFWSVIFLPLCLEIVAKGYNVILIAHSEFKPVKNPAGPDYDQYRPQLFKSIYNYTKKDLHGIFFMGREINVAVDQKKKSSKAVGDRKFIGLCPSPYYAAKTWCTPEGVSEIECGDSPQETWKNLKKVLGM